MSEALEDYLNHVMIYAKRTDDEAPAVRAELKDHLETKIEALQAQGLNSEDAVFRAIKDHGPPRIVGYGLRPRFPWFDIRLHGTARGVIAVGPKAVGVFAFGGTTLGVFTFGGFSAGVFSAGGFALGLLFAWGGLSLAPLGLAVGGMAAGLLVCGGMVAGIVAVGGKSIGMWAVGNRAISAYPVDDAPVAIQSFISTMSESSVLGWLTTTVLLGLGAALPLGLWLQAKERRRLNHADPWLAE